MNIEIIDEHYIKKHNLNDTILIEAIENYIKKSKFPRSLVLRKLILESKNIELESKNIEKLLNDGQESINKIIESSQKLYDKCDIILNNLKRDLNR